MSEKPSTIEYLKSLKVKTAHDRKDFKIDDLIITIIKYTTNKETINSSTSYYEVELICTNKNIFYSNCFDKKFNDAKEAEEYYELLIKKVRNNKKDKLLNAIKDDDISLL